MATEVQIALQPQAGQDPAAALAAAAAKLARSSLAPLIQQAGQPITGKVIVPQANLPAGFVQLAIADQVLTLKLSTPLPAGTPVRIDVQPSPNGQPTVTVQPLPRAAVTQQPPVQVQPQLPPLPQPAAPAPQQPAPQPQPLPPVPVASSPAPSATLSPTPLTAQASTPARASMQQAAPTVGQPMAPVAQPTITPTPAATPTTQMAPSATAPAPATASAPPAPPVVATAVATPAVASPPTNAVVQTAPPFPTPATTAAPTAQPSVLATQPTSPSPAPQQFASAVPQPTAPAPVQSPTSTLQAATPTPPTTPAAAPSAPQPATAQPAAPLPAQPSAPPTTAPAAPPPVLMQRLTQAFAPPAPPTPPTPAAAPQAQLATTQAAAQQQSAAPLLQALAVALPALPKEVADAATKVLATRVSLDRGAPAGEALKQAVLKSGVFLEPPKAGAQPDIRQALTQLRGTLLSWLGDDIAPVAAVTRRPPPPARGATPRAQGPELPPPPVEGGAKEAGKSLLGQTEGALSRLKLLQLTSQPVDAVRPGTAPLAAPTEWNLEIPMMLGRELAMAQIQIQRDGKSKSEVRDRSWRLRFALNLSVVGEVGAQMTMSGTRAAVALWADEPHTAETLEAMLPELGPALTAKGLELTSLVVRRGAPREESQPVGRLMDSRR